MAVTEFGHCSVHAVGHRAGVSWACKTQNCKNAKRIVPKKALLIGHRAGIPWACKTQNCKNAKRIMPKRRFFLLGRRGPWIVLKLCTRLCVFTPYIRRPRQVRVGRKTNLFLVATLAAVTKTGSFGVRLAPIP